jgi:hypothetical protein
VNDKLLHELSLPFHPTAVSWRVGATKDKRGMALAYGDLRAYQNRLDEVCGLGWAVSYTPWADKIICHVTINGITRSSTGESEGGNAEIAGTSAEAQAFKRACAMFGLGRYLYNFDSPWVDLDDRKAITAQGLAKLNGLVTQHYQRTMTKQVIIEKPEDINKVLDATTNVSEVEEVNPHEGFDDIPGAAESDANRWRFLADSLTGSCKSFADKCMAYHTDSDGVASPAQYKFLAGTLDKMTGGLHGVVLSVLCRREVNNDNPCGKLLASKLLDTINKQMKDRTSGQWVDNPNYREDIVNCLVSLAKVE